MPFQMPELNREQILALKDKTFGQIVADILNLFFSARLDGLDVDFCVGRYPVKLIAMSHRIVIGETWHNPDWSFGRMVRNLSGRIRGTEDTPDQPTNWAEISVRIAVLFGLFGELERVGIADPDHPIDLSVMAGDFSAPMSAWYAREMGLPIANIICSSNENAAVWDLIHHGELRTNQPLIETQIPQADISLPSDLERLIYHTLGRVEVHRYLQTVQRGGTYVPPVDRFETLRKGIYAAVISGRRTESIIPSVYRTSTYLLGPGSALAYGGLQDYRASTGETRPSMILTEKSPMLDEEIVAAAMGMTPGELRERM